MPFRGMPNRGFMGGPMGNPMRGGGFGRGGPFGGSRGQVQLHSNSVWFYPKNIFCLFLL